jgi:hypothetical protein
MTIRILLAAAAATLAACSPAPTAKSDPEPVAADYAVVAAPLTNARVTSPLSVSGTAPAAWYDGEQFDAILMGDDGTVYAQSTAQAASDSLTASDKPFTAEFAFAVSADTPATVVLQQQVLDEDQEQPMEVRVPVVLTPAG